MTYEEFKKEIIFGIKSRDGYYHIQKLYLIEEYLDIIDSCIYNDYSNKICLKGFLLPESNDWYLPSNINHTKVQEYEPFIFYCYVLTLKKRKTDYNSIIEFHNFQYNLWVKNKNHFFGKPYGGAGGFDLEYLVKNNLDNKSSFFYHLG